MSRLDRLYRQLIFTGFFKKGWGDPNHIKDLLGLRLSLSDPSSIYAVEITNQLLNDVVVQVEKETKKDKVTLIEASFVSPFHTLLPHMMPKECQRAKFQFMFNDESSSSSSSSSSSYFSSDTSSSSTNFFDTQPPVALHLAGTGDHFYYRRRALQGNPLLEKYGINSAFLENPFYGTRKPKDQIRSSVHYVNDIFIMGASLILESWVILNWLLQNHFGSIFCLTGVSMGGFNASLAAGFWRKSPVALVPCLSWSSAAPVFTHGILAESLPWKNLTSQFRDNSAFQELNRAISQREYGAKYIEGEFVAANSESSFTAAADDFKLNTLLTELSEARGAPMTLGTEAISPPSPPSSPPTQIRKFSTCSTGDAARMTITPWKRGAVGSGGGDGGSGGGRSDAGDYIIAKTFMKNLMDQFTHLGNYSTPLDPRMTQFLVATRDAYVPSYANRSFLERGETDSSIRSDDVRDVWPGCSAVELKDWGHVGAYLFKQNEYSKVIKSTVDKLQSVYFSTREPDHD